MADKIEIERLRRALPAMTEELVDMMVDEALPALHDIPGLTWPEVSITYKSAAGGPDLTITLSIKQDDDPPGEATDA